MKPAFPKWLKEMDPVLQAEETNAVFQAFRARRLDYGGGGWRSLFRRRARANMSPALIAMWIGLLAVVFVGCLISPFVAALAAVFLVPFIQQKSTRQRIIGEFLPKRVSQVFSEKGFFESAAIDLWLTGVKGSEVAEAIYLEKREVNFGSSVLALLVLWLVGIVGYGMFGSPLSMHGIGLSITFTGFMVSLFLLVMVGSIENISGYQLEDRLEYWKDSNPIGLRILRALKGIPWALLFVGPIAALLILYVALSNWAVVPFLRGSAPGSFFHYLHLRYVEYSFSGWFLFAGAYMEVYRRLVRPRYVRRCRELIAQADYPFNAFMACTVMGDAEGAAWARWLYLQGAGTVQPSTAPSPFPVEPPAGEPPSIQ